MKALGVSTKPRSAQRRALYFLLPFLLLAVVGGYLLIGHQIKSSKEARAEEQGFASLRQDMLTLQAEFEKKDAGWKYSEACAPKDNLYQSNIAATCSVILTLKPADAGTADVPSPGAYLDMVKKSDRFEEKAYARVLSDEGYASVTFEYGPLKEIEYHMTRYVGDIKTGSQDGYISFYCSSPAKDFYYSKLN